MRVASFNSGSDWERGLGAISLGLFEGHTCVSGLWYLGVCAFLGGLWSGRCGCLLVDVGGCSICVAPGHPFFLSQGWPGVPL